ncbi:pleckstrin homology domain-containing family G member 3-like [Aulostomus maculatus]
MPEGSLSSSYDDHMGEESHRLSAASVGSNECAPLATPPDSSDLSSSGRRPVSLISTLSSGSGSSREDNLAPPAPEASDPEIHAGLSPEEGAAEERQRPPADRKGPSRIQTNNKDSTPSRSQKASFIKKGMAPNPQLTYLDRVVMEIIETERMYVRDLRMIVEDYLSHIIDQSDLSIRPEQVCCLFGNIEDIYEFNSELLQALDLCDNDPVAVARCFVMKSEYFEIYTQYCNNYPNSVAALTECMRNKSLAKFFRERQASLKRSLPLGSYLLKPVQRILKYHLLLQEIVKHFDPEEEGYEVVEEAIYTMTGVAWYINDMKRKHEHAVRLQEVQSLLLNWKGPDLTTYGELVLEGTFKVHRAKNERTLFLFDRMLLITKRRGEHYVYKTHISCSTLMLIESAKDSLSFSVTHYKQPKQPHTVQAKTVEERKLWAHHIKRIILENHHAIIPQKAKDAILEMNNKYPPRYRYSPERLKKASSCQADELPRDSHQARRTSEPVKQTVNSSNGNNFNVLWVYRVCSHQSDSEGLCPRERRSLQPTGSDTEGSSHNVAERPPGGEEEEELGCRKDSLERLSCSDEEDECRFSPDQETEGEGFSTAGSNKENGQHPEEEESGGNKPTADASQPSADDLPQEKMSGPDLTENPEVALCSAPDSLSHSPLRTSISEDLKPEGDPEPPDEPYSATPDSDSKTLSSAESSEDEGEREAAETEAEATSILPSSVLDKADAIAQHFTNSIKRGSHSQDDARSLGCASPRLPSRTGSSLSLSAEATDRPLRLNSVCTDLTETFGNTDLTLLSPRDDSLFDAERGIQRRRDSTLSRQDQLLIGKIKSYYENAGNQDATFSLQRRESLTYIPTGLVRSSVSRLNSIPKTSPSPLTTSSSLDAVLPSDTQDQLVTRDSVESLLLDQKGSEDSGFNTGGGCRSRSQSVPDDPSEDEEFRPSSEMIKIWQTMEQQITRSQSEDSGHDQSQEASGNLKSIHVGLSNTSKTLRKSCDGESGELSAIREESRSPSPLKQKPNGENRTGSLKHTLKTFREDAVFLRAPVPRVAQLKAEGQQPSEDSNQLDDKAESKVLHLARQYSQRIKTAKPVVRQRSQGMLMRKKSLPCVVEEKDSSGKPNLTLQLVSPAPGTVLPHNGINQVRPSSPGLTCNSPGRARSRSPLSPTPPVEGFNWPDVQELRSKYSNYDRSQTIPVSRSHSIPEQMCDSGLRRRSSCSSSLLLTDGNSKEAPSHKVQSSADTGSDERRKRLQRANSLDPRLSRAQMSELQKLQDQVAQDSSSYYVAAEAPLPNDPEHKLIIMEKLTEAGPAETTQEPKEDEKEDSYVQIRSPTSREKISIMAVIDRCRAYQESDEYKQREEAKTRTEPAKSQDIDKTPASPTDQGDDSQKTSPNSGQQSKVKNLREKFQNLG